MNREESRGSWYLLTGLVIGIVLGFIYSRSIQPVKYIDTSPESLRAVDKDLYRSMIAVAFVSSGDLIRAKARLELLGDADISKALTEQAQRTLAEDGSSSEAQALGLLALAVGQDTGGILQSAPQNSDQPALAQNSTAYPGSNDPAKIGPNPSSTQSQLTPNPQLLYVLDSQREICDQSLVEPLVQIEVNDLTGQPIAGVKATISWSGGEEYFYTGLKPEKGFGYADFTLDPDFVYSIVLEEEGTLINDISPVLCSTAGGNSYWGSLYLKFSLQK